MRHLPMILEGVVLLIFSVGFLVVERVDHDLAVALMPAALGFVVGVAALDWIRIHRGRPR